MLVGLFCEWRQMHLLFIDQMTRSRPLSVGCLWDTGYGIRYDDDEVNDKRE